MSWITALKTIVPGWIGEKKHIPLIPGQFFQKLYSKRHLLAIGYNVDGRRRDTAYYDAAHHVDK
jgi:hypothetical protein